MKIEIYKYATFLKNNPSLYTLIFLFFFFCLLIFPIKYLLTTKEEYKLTLKKLETTTSQEIIIKKKLILLQKKIDHDKIKAIEYQDKFFAITYSSVPEVKIHIQNQLNNFNLSILNIYRTERDDISSEFNSEFLIYKIGIPIEITGTLSDLYNFLLFYNNYHKYIYFNNYPFSIKFHSKNLLLIKFYVSAITIFKEE